MPAYVDPWQPLDDVFENLMNWTEPSHLYHYTTIDSLVKIIETKHLRATHRYYLNDANDVIHGITRCIEATDDWAKSKTTECKRLGAAILTKLEAEKSGLENSPFTYSVSFSERKDGAAQWQVYGDYGRGIMLEFDFDRLKESLRVHRSRALKDEAEAEAGFSLFKATYENETQINSLLSLLNTTWSCFEGNPDGKTNAQIGNAAHLASYRLVYLATRCYKHESFDSEKEWKAVPNVSGIDHVHYDVRNGAMRRFIPMMLDLKCLESIYIGTAVPDPHVDDTVRFFLKKNRLEGVTVKRSEVMLVPPI